MAKSLVVAFGASIFLYSEHALANTVIYDPLNPHNTITPIPNADPEPSEYLMDGKITMESAESSSSQEQKNNTDLENTQNNEVQSKAPQAANQAVALLPESELEREEKTEDFSLPDPYLPKMKNRHNNQVLMLDEDFFSSMKSTALPPDSGGGKAGALNTFPDIAQSAYLLSGVVLYGEANGKLTARMSDYFAG